LNLDFFGAQVGHGLCFAVHGAQEQLDWLLCVDNHTDGRQGREQ
jgi:hypothetical protein